MYIQTVLTTGSNGYLCGNLCNHLDYNFIHYTDDIRHIDVNKIQQHDELYHFACPSDKYDFINNKKLTTSIIDGTLNMINASKKFGSKIVFASSIAIERDPVKYPGREWTVYGDLKLAMEHYIKSNCDNYIILRIPRVYSPCRNKGLMKQIKNNVIPEKDYNKEIQYITLQDFIDQTVPVLNENNLVFDYDITCKKTIGEISDWVLSN